MDGLKQRELKDNSVIFYQFLDNKLLYIIIHITL